MSSAQTAATTSDWDSDMATLLQVIRPEAVKGLLGELAAKHGKKQAMAVFLTGVFSRLFVVPLGLGAALDQPRAEAPSKLARLAQTLSQLDYKTGLECLSRNERRLYRAFSDIFAPFVTQLGQVMERVLGCYVKDDYDLGQDPDALILQAEQLDKNDHEAALNLIARAGAMALRGVSYWWRWEDEVAPPLRSWVFLTSMMVNTLTEIRHGPLSAAIVESDLWQQAGQEVRDEGPIREVRTGDKAPGFPARSLDPWIQRLYDGAEALTTEVRQAFAARAQEAIPALIALATNEDLWPEKAEGEGYTPIHAVELLGELHAAEAVPHLIDIVATSEVGEIIRDAAFYALEEIGSAAIPALLATLRYSRNNALKADLAPSLAEVGAGKAGVFEALQRLYQETTCDDRTLVVTALGILGDKRAIPLLRQDVNSPDLSPDDQEELYAVLDDLGAQGLRPAKARPVIAEELLAALQQGPIIVPPTPRIGRNDPCPCGSGKKYKLCCMRKR